MAWPLALRYGRRPASPSAQSRCKHDLAVMEAILRSIWMEVTAAIGAGHLEIHVAQVILHRPGFGEDRRTGSPP